MTRMDPLAAQTLLMAAARLGGMAPRTAPSDWAWALLARMAAPPDALGLMAARWDGLGAAERPPLLAGAVDALDPPDGAGWGLAGDLLALGLLETAPAEVALHDWAGLCNGGAAGDASREADWLAEIDGLGAALFDIERAGLPEAARADALARLSARADAWREAARGRRAAWIDWAKGLGRG